MPTLNHLLVFAAGSGNLALAEERIAAGADVSYFDSQSGSALFAAIRGHHTKIVELLLSHGADIHMSDHDGQGSLEYALYVQDDEIVEILLGAGARLKRHALPTFGRLLSEGLKRRAKKEPIQAAQTTPGLRPSVSDL